jgi:hypothetical protein
MRSLVASAALAPVVLAACAGLGGAGSGGTAGSTAATTTHRTATGADATFVVHVGQTRTLVGVHVGATVVCLGRGDSIRLHVPGQTAGANRYGFTFDRKLSLQVGPLHPLSPVHHGGVTATCRAN